MTIFRAQYLLVLLLCSTCCCAQSEDFVNLEFRAEHMGKNLYKFSLSVALPSGMTIVSPADSDVIRKCEIRWGDTALFKPIKPFIETPSPFKKYDAGMEDTFLLNTGRITYTQWIQINARKSCQTRGFIYYFIESEKEAFMVQRDFTLALKRKQITFKELIVIGH